MKIKTLTAVAICATMMACNSGKNQIADGRVIDNDRDDMETIDLQEIA